MSRITSLTLLCSGLDTYKVDKHGTVTPVLSGNIETLNEWLGDRGFGGLVDVSRVGGGDKYPQCLTFHCGYNSFDEDAFAAVVMATKWSFPENVVLIMKPEEGPTRVFRPMKNPPNFSQTCE